MASALSPIQQRRRRAAFKAVAAAVATWRQSLAPAPWSPAPEPSAPVRRTARLRVDAIERTNRPSGRGGDGRAASPQEVRTAMHAMAVLSDGVEDVAQERWATLERLCGGTVPRAAAIALCVAAGPQVTHVDGVAA